jgi:glycosyltransferase involved in cell wall biosynthesis/ubiquinone/menaquinone biosynthesis C-methylase UbiE
MLKVIRIARRKAVRRATRLSRNARKWFRRKLKQRALIREQPRAAAILEFAVTAGGRVADIQAMLAREIEEHGVALTCAAVHSAIGLAPDFSVTPRAQGALFTAALRAVGAVDAERAAAFGEPYVERLPDPRAMKSLVTLNKMARNYDRALALIEGFPDDEWRRSTTEVLLKRRLAQRLEREFAGQISDARAVGKAQVHEVAERLFAAVGPGDKMPAYRILRRVLGKEPFRSNKLLVKLLAAHADDLAAVEEKDAYIALAVCDAQLFAGRLSGGLESLLRLKGENPQTTARLVKVRSLKRLLDEGFDYRPAAGADGVPFFPVAGRVLCPLHNSLPYNSGGYAARTHGLLSGLVRRGWDVSGVTRLGYPQDVFEHRDKPIEASSKVGDVSYLRLLGRDVPYGSVMHDYLTAFTDALLDLARAERPEILHACSNHINGLAANAVARALGIKSVYEVRGLWEITRISRQPEWEGTEYFRMMSRMEMQAAMDADAVICITSALKQEMIRRGVPAEKITVVPNGVDVERFVPRARNKALAQQLGLAGKKVIGYVGSVVGYEGLDLLLRALVLLRERGVRDFAALVVGDGAALEELKRLAADLDLADLVVFTGRVPHEEVEEYYSIVDVTPFPRRSLPVTEMVSPLKPFEAMAMDKVVIASNVAALAEIVQDGVNGILFQKDDIGDLADKLEMVLRPGFASTLRPREWVVANRSWQHLSGITDALYKRLTSPLQPAPLVPLEKVPLSPDVRRTLDAYREKYDTPEDKGHLRRDDYARWTYVADRIRHQTSLLDVGVELGQFINAMALRGTFQRLVGVDIEAHPQFLRLSDDFAMEYASVAELPYQDAEFDVVTCMETLEHLPDEIFLQGLRELRRVCRKQLIVTLPFREEELSPDHVRRFDFADLEKLFPQGKITLFRKKHLVRGHRSFWVMIEESTEQA